MLADTFVTKAHFYRFFLHQTQRKHDSNVREKVWGTLFTTSPVLDAPGSLLRWGVGVGWQLATYEHPQIPIPVCCPRVPRSPQTRTDLVWTL